MDEDNFIALLKDLNVETGKFNDRAIKAWFDTDCAPLLKWMSSSITQSCYVSAQEIAEFSQLKALAPEQLDKKVDELNGQFPRLFETNSNLTDIRIAQDTIEILEKKFDDYEQEITTLENLNKKMLKDLSKVSDDEIQSQLDVELAEENCLKLNQELDEINKQTYNQLLKYGKFLWEYEYGQSPAFLNNVNMSEFETKFEATADMLNMMIKRDSEMSATSMIKSSSDTLSQLESRLFQSQSSEMILHMEVEALSSILKFLENYNVNSAPSSAEQEAILLGIEVAKEEQEWMIKQIPEKVQKLGEQQIIQPTLKCLRSELSCHQTKLSYLNTFKDTLMKILVHYVLIYNLHVQEQLDITSSSKFFRNIRKYVNNNLQDSVFRKDAMIKLISKYDEFCAKPLAIKLKLVGDFETMLLNGRNLSFTEIINEAAALNRNTEILKNQPSLTNINESHALKELFKNIGVLERFLISGPTCEIITVPSSLQNLFFEADHSLANQTFQIKLLIQQSQKMKERFSKDKWLSYRNKLWIYFMTDSKKFLYLLQTIKEEGNKIKL